MEPPVVSTEIAPPTHSASPPMVITLSAPPLNSSSSGPLAKRIDELLALLDQRLREFEAAMSAAPTDSQGSEPMGWSVRQKRAILNTLDPLGQLRDTLKTLLASGQGSAGRQELRDACGKDCQRIAHVFALTEMLTSLTSGSNLADDPRLKGCADACSAVEGVLRDSGLQARLVEAQSCAREALAEKNPTVVSRQLTRQMSVAEPCRTNCKGLLEQLDGIERGPGAAALEIVDELFDFYDSDGNQLLEGEEYDKVINDLAKHVMEEAEQRAAHYGKKGFVPSANVLKDWIKAVVDPNSDGAITREEARAGFKKVVDDID